MKKNNYFLPLILAFLLIGCTKTQYFSDKELELIDIYSAGDEFKMINNENDTLNFRIINRVIEEKKSNCSECFGATKYEELTYNLSINSKMAGKIYASSLEDEKNYLQYDFSIGRCHFWGSTDLALTNESVTINGVKYENITCSPDVCISRVFGFLKFSRFCDTLTLIK